MTGQPRTRGLCVDGHVLSRLGDRNRNGDIAAPLSISDESVKVHMKHIREKLGATDRTQALAIAMRRGFFHL